MHDSPYEAKKKIGARPHTTRGGGKKLRNITERYHISITLTEDTKSYDAIDGGALPYPNGLPMVSIVWWVYDVTEGCYFTFWTRGKSNSY